MVHSQLNPLIQSQPVIMKENHATRVKDIITKFFYKDNQLCFQILIRLENGSTIPYGEFLDFAAYKNSFLALQKAKAKGTTIELAEKSVLMDSIISKVA